jgi:hypothetical protein
VQQTVIGTGRAGIDITAFHKNALDPAQRQIPGDARAGGPAADNQNLRFQCLPPG